MSDPVGQASDLIVEDSPLHQSYTCGEFADSLHDTFAAWVEDLKPALEPDQKIAPAQIAFADADPPGELSFEGTLRVDCYLALGLRSLTGTLIISETGEVASDIVVGAAIIDGVLHGNIQASERVELQSQAKVFGNIESPALAIHPGAVFEGCCRFIPPLFKSPNGDSDGEETVEVEQSFAVVAAAS